MPQLNFQLHQRPTKKIFERYFRIVPPIVIDFWLKHGFGTVLGGYLKICNPAEYQDLLDRSYHPSFGPWATVFAATAMADLIVWDGGNIVMVDYRHHTIEVLESGSEYFFGDLEDEDTLYRDMKWKPFPKALKRLGEPAYDECFGYVPILAAGGAEKSENLKKMKLREHIALIIEFAGAI